MFELVKNPEQKYSPPLREPAYLDLAITPDAFDQLPSEYFEGLIDRSPRTPIPTTWSFWPNFREVLKGCYLTGSKIRDIAPDKFWGHKLNLVTSHSSPEFEKSDYDILVPPHLVPKILQFFKKNGQIEQSKSMPNIRRLQIHEDNDKFEFFWFVNPDPNDHPIKTWIKSAASPQHTTLGMFGENDIGVILPFGGRNDTYYFERYSPMNPLNPPSLWDPNRIARPNQNLYTCVFPKLFKGLMAEPHLYHYLMLRSKFVTFWQAVDHSPTPSEQEAYYLQTSFSKAWQFSADRELCNMDTTEVIAGWLYLSGALELLFESCKIYPNQPLENDLRMLLNKSYFYWGKKPIQEAFNHSLSEICEALKTLRHERLKGPSLRRDRTTCVEPTLQEV